MIARTQDEKQMRGELRGLRAALADWRSGRSVPWGMPWCNHRRTRPLCEGCCTRTWVQDHTDQLAERIGRCEIALNPAAAVPMQGELW